MPLIHITSKGLAVQRRCHFPATKLLHPSRCTENGMPVRYLSSTAPVVMTLWHEFSLYRRFVAHDSYASLLLRETKPLTCDCALSIVRVEIGWCSRSLHKSDFTRSSIKRSSLECMYWSIELSAEMNEWPMIITAFFTIVHTAENSEVSIPSIDQESSFTSLITRS